MSYFDNFAIFLKAIDFFEEHVVNVAFNFEIELTFFISFFLRTEQKKAKGKLPRLIG